MRMLVVLFASVLLAACGSRPPVPPAPPSKTIEICGAGFDQKTSAYLKAQIEKRGMTADAGFEQQARAAIFNMLKDMGMKDSDIGPTVQNMYKDYIECVKSRASEDSSRRKRYEAAACRRACCNQHECDSGCAMTNVEGLNIPVGDGSSSACPSNTKTGFRCMPTMWGGTWCGVMPYQVSFSDMRSCIRKCPSLDD